MAFTPGQSGAGRISELKKGDGSLRNIENKEDRLRETYNQLSPRNKTYISEEDYLFLCTHDKAIRTAAVIEAEEKNLEDVRSIWKQNIPGFNIHYEPTEEFKRFILWNTDDSCKGIKAVLDNQKNWIQDEVCILNQINAENCRYKQTILNNKLRDKYWTMLQSVDRIQFGFNEIHDNFFIRIPLIISSDEPYKGENFQRLGYYSPKTKTVTIVEKGIEKCSSDLGFDIDVLRAVVLAHELGHYITHTQDPDPSNTEGDFEIGRFEPITDISECFAQLIALRACSMCNGEYLNTFWKLAENQGKLYNTFRKYTNITDIMSVIARIKSDSSVSGLSDVDEIL